MKKTTKLLSVILAFVMALSCMTMMASAAKTSYQTVKDLDNLHAYSPNGTVTRLTTEARLSILFDALDPLLAKLNISMNVPVVNIPVDLTSVTGICTTVDEIEGLLGNFIMKGLAGLALGIVGDLELGTWDKKGMTRDNQPQLVIAAELLELLSNNTGLINSLLTDGIDLGLATSALGDMSAINNLVTNIPGAIKGIVLPLMGRQDDDDAQRKILGSKESDLLTVAQKFVEGLFTKPMNWTSYRVDAAGNNIGYTLDLPTEADGTSRYFVFNADKTKITQYDYKYEGLLGDPAAGYKETVTYTKSETEETEGSGIYLYEAPASYNGDRTLKWYKAGDPSSIDADNPDTFVDANGRVQSSYWLPTVAKAFKDGSLTLGINNDTDSVRGLVYKFAPYLFREMATTVLNGSAKKLIAEAFDVKFTKLGDHQDDAAVVAEKEATGNPDNFFTKAQDYYVWEYSDYKVIDGVPYYRYQDQYFKGEIPKNISAYYYMFNWGWNIPDNFMDEFIPTTDGTTWALDGLNNLIKKAIDTMIADTWTVKGTTYKRADVFNWTPGGNENLINNLMVCARNFFNIAPEEIVDEYYKEAQFYNAMMNGTPKQAVNGLVCELVKLIMPQIKFPNNIIDQPITAIAAVVVRELCTQLMPTYNFDAMIYANYGDASNKERTLRTYDSADEWLNITLYMGVNLGMYYLRNIADVGEDSDLGYYSVMSDLGAIPAVSNRNTTAAGDAMTFTATSYKLGDGTPSWLVAVDWIVDWALATNVQWAWRFGNFVDCGSEVNLATYQNPFNKIDTVLLKLLPLDEIFNVSGLTGTTYGSGTFLEKVLKDGIVDSIVNLDVTKLLGLVKIPDGSALRSTKIADTLVKLVVDLLNSIFYKVAGNVNLIDTGVINSVSTLLVHDNIKAVVSNLVGKLYTAYGNGLLDTLLPFLNFFVGWTTDPQKFAEPEMTFRNDSGYDYFYTGGKESLTVRNTSSGMLLRHYDDDKETPEEDTAYAIKLNNITSDDGTITVSTQDILGPGESKTFENITTTDTSDRAVITTVNYSFTGKNGQALGGEQHSRVMTYVSAKAPSSSPVAQSSEYKYSYIVTTYVNFVRNAYDKIQFVGNAAQIDNFAIGFKNNAKYATWVISATQNEAAAAPLELDTTSYVHGASENQTLKADGIGHMEDSGAMAITFNNVLNEKELVSGSSYYGGKVSLSIGNQKRSNNSRKGVDNLVMPTFYFYDGAQYDRVRSAVNSTINVLQENYNTAASGFAADWATFKAARDAAAKIGYQPMQIDTFATEYSLDNLKKVVKDLEDAKKALDEKYLTNAGVDVSKVQATLDTIETNPNGDLNFQDYRLFEYFQYEKQRTGARNMIKSVTPPAAPENHIDSVWGNDLVNAIVNAQTGKVQDGVRATIEEPTADDVKNHTQAVKDFVPASHSILNIENQSAMLTYYANFMKAKPKAVDLTFINKEIAYAEAQNYDSALYSADSWARYEKALADAKAITASSLQSDAFNAKYELMVAQNKLQLKERSMKEVGYMNEELIPLIQHANAIIANFDSGLYKVKDGVDVTAAFAQLVKALGVEYNVTVDGNDYAGILYDHSALTFKEYDRTATAKNKRAVDGASDKLRAAIENFVCTATVEAGDTTTKVDQTVRYIQGITPNSLRKVDDLKAKLTVSSGVTPVYTVSKAGQYGTGARVELKASDAPDAELYATYFVVIYGDVNGDGAVDALDAIEVDYANHTAYYMGDIYDDAADIDGNGKVDGADYAAIENSVRCSAAINQNPTH